MKNNLWVEKHRPKTTDDYVFVDLRQKQQILSWISSETIPHLILSGDPGTGKCLAGEEMIEIMIDDSSLTSEQKSKLGKYMV